MSECLVLEKGAVIPKGCVYTRNHIDNNGTYKEYEKYQEGETLPSNVEYNDMFYTPDYVYTYHEPVCFYWDDEGWGAKVKDTTKKKYEPLYEKINGKKLLHLDATYMKCENLEIMPIIPNGVLNMNDCFYGCVSLKETTFIPCSVTDMDFTFYGCKKLERVLNIPEKVKSMVRTFNDCISLKSISIIPKDVYDLQSTFAGCVSLSGNIVINAENINAHDFDTYNCCFDNCAQDIDHTIKLTGKCPLLNEIAKTAYNKGEYVEIKNHKESQTLENNKYMLDKKIKNYIMYLIDNSDSSSKKLLLEKLDNDFNATELMSIGFTIDEIMELIPRRGREWKDLYNAINRKLINLYHYGKISEIDNKITEKATTDLLYLLNNKGDINHILDEELYKFLLKLGKIIPISYEEYQLN